MTMTEAKALALTTAAWRASISETSTFTDAALSHEAAAAAHEELARDKTLSAGLRDIHRGHAKTHREEAQLNRRVIAAGR